MTVALALFGLEFARPAGALVFVLPLVLILASLRRPAASGDVRPLGTARFLPEAEDGRRRGTRLWLPPSRLAALVALLAAAFACLGPRPPVGESPAVELLVVVDLSPSMHLPIDPAQPGGATRLEAAAAELVRLAEADWKDAFGARIELAWAGAEGDRLLGAPESAAGLPARLAPLPVAVLAAPRWPRWDTAGTVWLTDRQPGEGRSAGLVAIGGPPVHGPIAWSRDGVVTWEPDGGIGVAPPAAVGVAPPEVRVAPDIAPEVERFVRAWATDRGLPAPERGQALRAAPGIVRSGGGLAVVGPARGGAPVEIEIGGDGWRAAALAPAESASRAPWRVSPGRLDLAFAALRARPSDEVSFASDLANALDAALVLPPGIIAMDERAGAGQRAAVLPVPPTAGAAPERYGAALARARRSARLLETGAAAAAALAALAAAILRLRGR